MSTVTSTTVAQPPGGRHSTDEPLSIVLHGVSWETYSRLCDEVPHRMPHAYDAGVLELMTHSLLHGRYHRRLARLLDVLTEELNIPILSGGAMTLKEQSVLRGVEPDDVYWIAGEAAMRGKTEFTPGSDPPPDLVIETEISRTVIDRLQILAALGVGEVWRSSPEGIEVLLLNEDGTYEEATASKALPLPVVAELAPFARIDDATDETTLIRQFREWVRERFADQL